MSEKKKHPIIRMKKLSREKITRVDAQTFYHPSSDPKKEPYFVFRSLNPQNKDEWSCDCLRFTFNMVDSNSPTPACKHILAIIDKYQIK